MTNKPDNDATTLLTLDLPETWSLTLKNYAKSSATNSLST